MEITAVVVPHICDPISAQPIDLTRQHFRLIAIYRLTFLSDQTIAGMLSLGE